MRTTVDQRLPALAITNGSPPLLFPTTARQMILGIVHVCQIRIAVLALELSSSKPYLTLN